MLQNLKVTSNHTFAPPEIIIKAIAKEMVEYKSPGKGKIKMRPSAGNHKCGTRYV